MNKVQIEALFIWGLALFAVAMRSERDGLEPFAMAGVVWLLTFCFARWVK